MKNVSGGRGTLSYLTPLHLACQANSVEVVGVGVLGKRVFFFVFLIRWVIYIGLSPLPRMQSSPPGFLYIFSRGSRTKPSFATVTGRGDNPIYTLPPIIMEVKNGCISNRIVTFQILPFSTSMNMGERVGIFVAGFRVFFLLCFKLRWCNNKAFSFDDVKVGDTIEIIPKKE